MVDDPDPLSNDALYARIIGLESAAALALALLFRDKLDDLDRLEDLAIRINGPDEQNVRRRGVERLVRNVRSFQGVLEEMERDGSL